MPFALYMDVRVPSAITNGLCRRGLDVLTAQEDGAREVDDDELLARATALNRLLFTQDNDFLTIAAGWQTSGRDFLAIVFCPQLRLGIGEIIDELELIAHCARSNDVRNCVIYIPLQ
jgi:hypothetical protein